MIGLIAGSGRLPQILIDHWLMVGTPFCVIALNSPLFSLPEHIASQVFPLGHIGAMLIFLKKHHVTHLVLAGSLTRPSLKDLKTDFMGLKWIKKLGMAWMKGDDGLLRGLLQLLESEGFTISSPQEHLPDLLTPSGYLTTKHPAAHQDIQIGFQVLAALSPFDIGQAVIVHEGRVLGIEGPEGTENLIARCEGGVLVKAAKETQTLSIDLPSIGVNTILQAKHLEGIALQAYKTQIIQKEQVIELCEEHNLFLGGFER